VADAARVLDVIRGYDPADPVTATQVGYTPTKPLWTFTERPSLAGRRLGIVREFMPNVTVNDTESIRVFSEEVIPILRKAGAELVESINPRDIALGWATDDPAIPNIDIQSIVADMVPTLEPSFLNASTLNTPSTTTGLLPNNLRLIFDPVGSFFPSGTDLITKSVQMAFDQTLFPAEISLRQFDRTGAGTLNEGRYGIEKMLVARGDARVTKVTDLSIDFEDLDGDGNTTEHISFLRVGDDGNVVQRNRIAVTPTIGVPATPAGTTLDTQGSATHLARQQAIRQIVARIMAEYQLDALVYPYETIPSKILTGTVDSIAWLTVDGRPNRGINGFVDGSGLPDIGVPAGFTKVVYDRTTRGTTAEYAISPSAVKRDVMLPFSVQFMGNPWSEPTLLEIAAAFEAARGPRMPPPDVGPIPGEP
jgi:Asp-tRNA(Asn)/Glu-tRNA(Gln) amidotransferase A subunit family amidase